MRQVFSLDLRLCCGILPQVVRVDAIHLALEDALRRARIFWLPTEYDGILFVDKRLTNGAWNEGLNVPTNRRAFVLWGAHDNKRRNGLEKFFVEILRRNSSYRGWLLSHRAAFSFCVSTACGFSFQLSQDCMHLLDQTLVHIDDFRRGQHQREKR